jgi:hypothetical protein
MKLSNSFLLVSFMVTMAFNSMSAVAQPRASYSVIETEPSAIHWCLPEAGDDPSHIIEGRCKVYRECLSSLSLDERVDRLTTASMTPDQVIGVRKCHQALFNAARLNPQVKGSAATQQWLTHSVYPGTEAKSFAIPANLGEAR